MPRLLINFFFIIIIIKAVACKCFQIPCLTLLGLYDNDCVCYYESGTTKGKGTNTMNKVRSILAFSKKCKEKKRFGLFYCNNP